MRPALFALTIVLAVCASSAAQAGEDDYVRWSLVTPASSPYHIIRYEITKRRPATTAIHRRNLPGLDESLHALGLMTPEESDALFAKVVAEQPMTLADAVPAKKKPGVLRWRCDLHIDGKDHSFEVTDPLTQPDHRYARIFELVRSAVILHAGELPFRNVFFPAASRGWINVESIPTARLWVDGLDTQLDTPIYAYEIAAGPHEVRLVSPDGRYDRTYQVRVEAQGTTTLRVDLR